VQYFAVSLNALLNITAYVGICIVHYFPKACHSGWNIPRRKLQFIDFDFRQIFPWLSTRFRIFAR